jgi:adenylate cyclase class IV
MKYEEENTKNDGENAKILEARGKIKNIDDARNTAKKIGGIFKGYYSATDIIFKTNKTDSEEGVIYLRIFKINSRQTKNYVFTHKIAEWSDNIKTDKIIIKSTFNTMEETFDFMTEHYGDELKKDYEYSREGWEYSLGKNGIFIERIDTLGPSLEIEAENKNDLENLFRLFEVSERFSESTPEIMKKLLGKYMTNTVS